MSTFVPPRHPVPRDPDNPDYVYSFHPHQVNEYMEVLLLLICHFN